MKSKTLSYTSFALKPKYHWGIAQTKNELKRGEGGVWGAEWGWGVGGDDDDLPSTNQPLPIKHDSFSVCIHFFSVRTACCACFTSSPPAFFLLTRKSAEEKAPHLRGQCFPH